MVCVVGCFHHLFSLVCLVWNTHFLLKVCIMKWNGFTSIGVISVFWDHLKNPEDGGDISISSFPLCLWLCCPPPHQPPKALVNSEGCQHSSEDRGGNKLAGETWRGLICGTFSLIVAYMCEVCPFEIRAYGKLQFVIWNPFSTAILSLLVVFVRSCCELSWSIGKLSRNLICWMPGEPFQGLTSALKIEAVSSSILLELNRCWLKHLIGLLVGHSF